MLKYSSYLNDIPFLKKIDYEKNKTQWVKITILDWKEREIVDIQGRVSAGSLSYDGKSSVRRTGNITFVADQEKNNFLNIDNILSINKKVSIAIGYTNIFGAYSNEDIIWFPLGVYVYSSISISHSIDSITVSMDLKDKMCLLNGYAGGVIPASTYFDAVDDYDENGQSIQKKVLIYQLIQELVNHWGNEDLNKILIADIDNRAKKVMRWLGDSKLYRLNNELYDELTKRQGNKFTYGKIEFNYNGKKKTIQKLYEILLSYQTNITNATLAFQQYNIGDYKTGLENAQKIKDKALSAASEKLSTDNQKSLDNINNLYKTKIENNEAYKRWLDIYEKAEAEKQISEDALYEQYYGDNGKITKKSKNYDSSIQNAETKKIEDTKKYKQQKKNKQISDSIYKAKLQKVYKIYNKTVQQITQEKKAAITPLETEYNNKVKKIAKIYNEAIDPATTTRDNDVDYKKIIAAKEAALTKEYNKNQIKYDNRVRTAEDNYNKEKNKLDNKLNNKRKKIESAQSNYKDVYDKIVQSIKKTSFTDKNGVDLRYNHNNNETLKTLTEGSQELLEKLETEYATLLEEINTLNKQLSDDDEMSLKKQYQQLKDSLMGLEDTSKMTDKELNDYKNKLKNTAQEINNFKSNVCVNVLSSTYQQIIDTLNQNAAQIKNATAKQKKLDKELNEKISKIKTEKNKKITEKNKKDAQIEVLKTNIQYESISNAIIEGISIQEFDYGMDVGYQYTDFVYDGELICNAGDNVCTILDKIKDRLGNYEYFYDIYGFFHFQEVKNYVNTSQSTTILNFLNGKTDNINDVYKLDQSRGKAAYVLDNTQLSVSYNSNPQFEMIKNDFVVWGTRKSASGQEIPLRYHLAIDRKPDCQVHEEIFFIKNEDDEYRMIFPVKIKDYSGRIDDIYYYNTNEKTIYTSNLNLSKIYKYEVELADADLNKEKKKINKIFNKIAAKNSNAVTNKEYGLYTLFYSTTAGVGIRTVYKWIKQNLYDNNGLKANWKNIIDVNLPIWANKVITDWFNKLCTTTPELASCITTLTSYIKEYVPIWALEIEDMEAINDKYPDGGKEYKVLKKDKDFFIKTKYETKDWRTELFIQGGEDNAKGINPNYYFAELSAEWEKIYDTYKQQFRPKIKANNLLMNYFLDFIDTGSSAFQFNIDNIGRRSLVENKNEINCIFEQEIPNKILITNDIEDGKRTESMNKAIQESKDKNEEYMIIDTSVMDFIGVGGIHNAALDEIRNLLSIYTDYNETVNISCIPIYHIEPNTIINIVDEQAGVSGNYLINNISLPLAVGEQMSLSCTKILNKI